MSLLHIIATPTVNPSGNTTALASAIGLAIATGVSSASGSLSWEIPTTLADESALGAASITGAEIWKHNGSTFILDQTISGTSTTSINPTSGIYAVRLAWNDGVNTGYTALSDPIDTTKHELDATATIFTTADSKTTVQTALSAASPGDVFYFRAGTYTYDWKTSHGAGFTVGQSGNSTSPIVISSYPGEWAVFEGWGDESLFATAESNNWNWPDSNTDQGQTIFNLTGQYIELRNLEIKNSARYGVLIANANNQLYNVRVDHCWFMNIGIGVGTGTTGSVANTRFTYVESAHCRHGGGMSITHETSPYPTDANDFSGIIWDKCLVYANGRIPSTKAIAGLVTGLDGGKAGGNSDGCGIVKWMNKNEPVVSYLTNSLVQNFTMYKVIAFGNADNQIDVCPGSGFRANQCLTGNLRSITDSTGARGIKWFLATDGSIELLGNLSFSANRVGGGDGFFPDLETAESQIQIINNGGYEQTQTVINMDQCNNASMNTTDSVLKNNMQYLSAELTDANTAVMDDSNNWSSGDPSVNDPQYDFGWPDALDATGDPMSRFQSFYRQIMAKFAPTSTSGMIGGGVVTNRHATNPADDPTSPADPSDVTKLPWFEEQTGTTTTAADQGPVPYQLFAPPLVTYTSGGA